MAQEESVTFIVTPGSKGCEVKTLKNPYVYVIRQTKSEALDVAFKRYIERLQVSENTTKL